MVGLFELNNRKGKNTMEIKNIEPGYSYHIKNSFFRTVQDKYLMINKENKNYRPHYLAIKDKNNENIYWMVPISSRVEKYKAIKNRQMKQNKKQDTIVIGTFGGKNCAFLIQNAFPVIAKYFDHIHTKEGKPVYLKKNICRTIVRKLTNLLKLHDNGQNYIYPDIDRIYKLMENELKRNKKRQSKPSYHR